MAPAESLSATRTSYDTVAVSYAEHVRDELAGKPVERAMVGLFASVVDGPVVDVGCGTGIVTAELVRLGHRSANATFLVLQQGRLLCWHAAHVDQANSTVRELSWTVGAESLSQWNRGARPGALLSVTEHPNKRVILSVETTDYP